MKFEELTKLDRDKVLRSITLSNSDIPLYCIIRPSLFDLILRDKLNLGNADKSIPSKNLLGWLKYISISLMRNLFFVPKKPIYFLSPEILFQLKGDIYINRLFNEFIMKNKSEVHLLTFSSMRKYNTPNQEGAFHQNIIHDLAAIISRFKRIKKRDKLSIEKFINRLNYIDDSLLTKQASEKLFFSLTQISKRARILTLLYDVFFKLKSPKLIILEAAHYMGEKAFIINAAKKNNIKVAEFQHGYIGKTHQAYNFDHKFIPFIKQHLPEYLLTFGNYWNNKVNTPSIKVTIGNPELIKKTISQKSIKLQKKSKKTILFISTTFYTEKLIYIANRLADSDLNDFLNVKIRPHPSEKESFYKNFQGIIGKGVFIDNNESLYETLEETEVVVSEVFSTTLYEAINFTSKIYIGNSNYVDYYELTPLFIQYSDYENLYNSIKNNTKITIDSSFIWEEFYLKKFRSFIDEQINKSNHDSLQSI